MKEEKLVYQITNYDGMRQNDCVKRYYQNNFVRV